jgi:two-component system, LuxR family, sensor kinase FixL
VDLKHSLEDLDTYELLFEHAPDSVVMIDQFNTIRFWNKKSEEIFGWTSETVIGKNTSEVMIPPRFREAHNNGMKRFLSTGEVRVLNKTIEVPALHKNGNEFFISLTISKLQLSGVTNFLAFIRDVTEQKNNQTVLEQKTRELEQANERLEQFASIASHDLKEPLRKLRIYSSQITSDDTEELSPKVKSNLIKINESARRMQELIDGVLSYSSLNAEQVKEHYSLNEILQSVLNNLEDRITELNAIIEYQNLPSAYVIPFQMEQLFQNLISNALKFSIAGKPPVINITYSIIAQNEMADQTVQPSTEYLQINVSDNGIGFNNEAAEKIFGLFQRLNAKAAYEGSGLGLAICKRVVENHGGIIRAHSTPGNGATFTIILPLRD